MAKCIECRKRAGLFSCNYAGKNVAEANEYPDRISGPWLPGGGPLKFSPEGFLCVTCANKRKYECAKHGNIDDKFDSGCAPQCRACKTESHILSRRNNILSWQPNMPVASGGSCITGDSEGEMRFAYFCPVCNRNAFVTCHQCGCSIYNVTIGSGFPKVGIISCSDCSTSLQEGSLPVYMTGLRCPSCKYRDDDRSTYGFTYRPVPTDYTIEDIEALIK